MSALDWFFSPKVQLIVAGMAGGIVRTLSLKEGPWDAVMTIVIGTLCALYLSPVVLHTIEPALGVVVDDKEARAGFAGFLVGFSGSAIAGLFLDAWVAKLRLKKASRPHGEDEPRS